MATFLCASSPPVSQLGRLVWARTVMAAARTRPAVVRREAGPGWWASQPGLLLHLQPIT